MSKAFYAGSFDPVTNGHVDLMRRAARLFDELIVGIYVGTRKKAMIALADRKQLLEEAVADIDRVQVITYDKLTVEVARQMGATVLVRGLRIGTDFEYEREMALSNRALDDAMDTVFLMSSLPYQFVSSSRVKEITSLGGDIKGIVPLNVSKFLSRKRF